MGTVGELSTSKDLVVILRLWIDPSDATVRGRLLVPAWRVDYVVRGEQQLVDRIVTIVRSFEGGSTISPHPPGSDATHTRLDP